MLYSGLKYQINLALALDKDNRTLKLHILDTLRYFSYIINFTVTEEKVYVNCRAKTFFHLRTSSHHNT